MKQFFALTLVATATSLCFFQPVQAGYLQEDETEYMKNFAAHMDSSHADGDHASRLNVCRASPPFFVGHKITVEATTLSFFDNRGKRGGRTTAGATTTTSTAINKVLTSSEVQQQCHESYICVIPKDITVEMTTSLHVGALEIHGKLVWNDHSQTQEEAHLCAGYVAVEKSGSYQMDLQSKRAWIYIVANGAKHPTLGWRAFGGSHAKEITIKGRPLQRTWTLLDQPLNTDSTIMRVLHDPEAMGWKIGDRIGVAPTESQSKGTGQVFTITHVASDGTILLDNPAIYDHKAQYLPNQMLESSPPILMAAEVVNLSRNIVITGDDFENIPCDPKVKDESEGCMCTDYRDTCTVGLHTAMMKSGVMRVSNARVEKCGQRGILGKYCLHFHHLQDCPDCLLDGNVVESSQQRGIIIHDTHRSLIEKNVLWNVRGAGIYVEDGNEMYNSFEYNVVICPYPLEDQIHHGCTIPGTSNGSSDDRRNQAGFYIKSSTNDLIGNRAANSRNGMFAEAGVDGDARGEVCPLQTSIGRWEGNTFHGHARFGTYPIKFFPQDTDRSIETNGYNLDQSLCNGFDKRGDTNGKPAAIVNHVDYDNIFVGQYEVGDIQYKGHVSINNKNLMYWKETKNFEDGCSAHISKSYYANGNLALPDQATVILQDTKLENVSLEANHHCKVGSTGFLCMPQYIFHNIEWSNDQADAKWLSFQEGDTEYGGIFSLSPQSQEINSPFPKGYVSLVSDRYDYLLDTPRNLCESSYHLGFSERYDNGILCKVPLRALKVYTRGLKANSAPSLKVEVWFDNKDGVKAHSRHRATTTQFYPFHHIGDDDETKRQGYSFPVIPSSDVSYRLSITSGDRNIPSDWVVEFSDPVVGNRWGEEYVQLELRGRSCTDNGVVSSHHDRRFINSGLEFLDDRVWGKHGACVKASKMPAERCDADGDIEATECPNLCDSCNTDNSYCDCRTATCRCKAGFMGDNCSIDLCVDKCGSHGACTGLYLGATLPIQSIDHACIDNGSSSRHLSQASSAAKAQEDSSALRTLLRVAVPILVMMAL